MTCGVTSGPVLGIDTAGGACTVAVVQDGATLSVAAEERSRGHAERLLPMAEEVLAKAGLTWAEIAAIGAGTGPGNFTGIRITVAAARGLALSLDVPAVGVSALEALAYGQAGACTAVVAGRRDGVYAQHFPATGAPAAPWATDITTLAADLPPSAVLVGDAAEAVADRSGGHVAAPALPRAVAIATIAARRAGTVQAAPKPLYLRAPDAAPVAVPNPA